MSIIFHRRRLRDHPELNFLRFDLARLLNRVRAEFPEFASPPPDEIQAQLGHGEAAKANTGVPHLSIPSLR
jgi:hypothetical protein